MMGGELDLSFMMCASRINETQVYIYALVRCQAIGSCVKAKVSSGTGEVMITSVL